MRYIKREREREQRSIYSGSQYNPRNFKAILITTLYFCPPLHLTSTAMLWFGLYNLDYNNIPVIIRNGGGSGATLKKKNEEEYVYF